MSKIAIVTGASGGIGQTIAKKLAQTGYAVCLHYFAHEERALALKNDLCAKGVHAIAVQADMTKEDDILELFATVDEKLGPVDVLINNAGINGGRNRVLDIKLQTLSAVFTTNVFAPFLLCREAIKRMQIMGGNIINITSETAKFGGREMAHYAASKAALNTFTQALAKEVAAINIRVNGVSPGVIDTAMHTPDSIQTLLPTLPMGRLGTTEEVAELVAWLISDKASYISGAIIPVSGAR